MGCDGGVLVWEVVCVVVIKMCVGDGGKVALLTWCLRGGADDANQSIGNSGVIDTHLSVRTWRERVRRSECSIQASIDAVKLSQCMPLHRACPERWTLRATHELSPPPLDRHLAAERLISILKTTYRHCSCDKCSNDRIRPALKARSENCRRLRIKEWNLGRKMRLNPVALETSMLVARYISLIQS